MTQAAEHTLMAVDGGGTSCRFALCHHGRRHEIKHGAANYTTDPEASIDALRTGLSALRRDASLADAQPIPTFIGIAGVMDDADGAAISAALGLTVVRVADDRPAAVRGGLGQGDGFVASLGTGSFFARQQGGVIRLAGGWGSRLGDEASGYAIGRALLARTLAAIDGLAESSPLTEAALAAYGGSAKRLVRETMRAGPADIARFARDVAVAADAGDPVGQALLKEAAGQVAAILTRLGWQAGDRICMMGSVARALVPYLPAPMAGTVVAPQGSALDGALALAGDLAHSHEANR